MSFLEIRTPIVISVIIIIASLPVSGFFLLFGVANLIHPDVSDDALILNAVVCLVLCGIGVASLLVAIAAFRGILFRIKSARGEHNT
jgi:hypothetical protein